MGSKCIYFIFLLCSLAYIKEATCEADPQLGIGNLRYGRRPNFPGNVGYGSNTGYNQYRGPPRYPFGSQNQPGYGYGSGRGIGYGNRPGGTFPPGSGGGVLFGYAYRRENNFPAGNIFGPPNYGKK
ncbi:unnamed protein product [Diabrotica balteata]|uniref:Uncharacterized protein n=1 Tax=Diabrotica balteata TaxID=107213 RepID=A0A9P0GUB0_DIABA|nr:unnamed protein product [Diabrotica balteata]